MKSRPLIETVAIYCLLVFIGFTLADLGILYFRDQFLPTPPPPGRSAAVRPPTRPDRNNYNVITSRIIFNADQKIADPLGSSQNPNANPDAPPVPSTLPIQLVGTIVHVNSARSIATITLKNKNEQVSLRLDEIIPENQGKITKIERSKVIFRNTTTQRLEYIEMKDESKINFGSYAPKAKQVGEVMQKSDTDFDIKRDDINRLTSNLPELLQQARAVPRTGPNGQIECFSLADIAAGSIYERLGLKRGDCIKSVNGEKIDSPAKAMELYNALRANSNAINLGVERGGQDENFNYNITQ